MCSSGCVSSAATGAGDTSRHVSAEPFRRKPTAGCSSEEVEGDRYCATCNPTDARGCARYCDAGNGGACYLLGLSLEMNRHDDISAIAAFERACALGSGGGCESFARLLISGRGRPKEEERAVEILEETCQAGRLQSCILLGEAHLTSGRSYANRKVGFGLLEQACRQGGEEACQVLSDLPFAERDPEGAIRRARERAASCELGGEEECVVHRRSSSQEMPIR